MRKLAILFLVVCCAGPSCTAASNDAEAQRLSVANAMVEAWNARDWESVYELFAEDGVLHSVMIEPVVGRDAIRERLTPLLAGVERIELQIANIGVVDDVVMFERVDDFVYNGKHSRVPVVGVMEISDGKIDEWREYYDKATLAAALAGPGDSADPEAPLLELTRQLSVDWNAGRMAEYLAAYSDEAPVTLMTGDRIVPDKDDVIALFTSSWKTEAEMGDFDTKDVDVRIVAPGLAVVVGFFEHRFEHETVNGSFTHVWQKNNVGVWKIIHEHTARAAGE